MRALRWLLALAVAALVTEVLAAAAATQFVLRSLAGLGVEVSVTERLGKSVRLVSEEGPAKQIRYQPKNLP